MVTFDETWDAITARLQGKAKGLGVPVEQIIRGYIGKIGEAPFIYVYLMPETGKGSEGNHVIARADVTILCGVEGANDKSEALVECNKLAGRVATVMKNAPGVTPCNPAVSTVSNSADQTVLALFFTAPYNHYQPLLAVEA